MALWADYDSAGGEQHNQRFTLAEIQDGKFSVGNQGGKELSEQSPDNSKCVPDKQSVVDDSLLQHSTPSGFTLEEVLMLGDFPDYAVLSGVPLPKAYPEFDIRTAKPRLYRPIRWAYHQTMSFKKMEPD
ncbi:hypothetical protein H2203_006357 [Taxawa tesnikishii (nom. ined.)]|nr:hypothetical protein H2203_006357 [Dothideales sp. JES 119]